MRTVDVSYGGENGFNQAIELSAEVLANVKFIKEKKLISQYFEQISQDTGRYCFGVSDTMKALEMGAVETVRAALACRNGTWRPACAYACRDLACAFLGLLP